MAKAWGPRYITGERAVANFDEDSLTMALEAVVNCLDGMDPKTVNELTFASTTSPYLEKQASTLIAAAADLPEDLYTADHLSSLRSGTASLKSAMDAVMAGSAKNSLVAAADSRRGEPGSDSEQLIGDASAAILIGETGVAAAIEGFYCHSEEFLDAWRKQGDVFLKKEDLAFTQTYGYVRIVKDCVEGILKKYEMNRSNIAHFILQAPDSRVYSRVIKSLNLPPKSFLEDPLLTTIGDTGASSPLLQLIAVLERAQAGERILLCSYGAGVSDAFILQVTPEVERLRKKRGVSYFQAIKYPLTNYEKFLKFQHTLPSEPLEPFSSWALLWKERKQNLQLYGTHCKQCGTFAYPRRRVCQKCSAKDEYEDTKLSRQGKVYTFAKDYLYPSLNSPTVMVVADMEGGGRFYGQLTDCDPAMVSIGMDVEFTFRRIHEGGGFYNYFWKLRPLEEKRDAR
ncbi:MAG: 3-hydroxy-3-methylglutaryl CoA synthase [Deltaproteobacteria bacterium]|nr:MAG: 3-hydroxy-3-methylglutaryl CoA synthase [Deltaproteobacteria bacterium]